MGWLTPDVLVAQVVDITADWLIARGLRGILCDLDNTIAPWRSEAVPDEVEAWLEALRGAELEVCLVSNTHNLARLGRLARRLRIEHVPVNAGKPGTRGVREGLRRLRLEPSEAAMVGDQLFTDIVAGNRAGLTTILVNPLTPREFVGTKWVSRNLERLVLRGARRRPG